MHVDCLPDTPTSVAGAYNMGMGAIGVVANGAQQQD